MKITFVKGDDVKPIAKLSHLSVFELADASVEHPHRFVFLGFITGRPEREGDGGRRAVAVNEHMELCKFELAKGVRQVGEAVTVDMVIE